MVEIEREAEEEFFEDYESHELDEKGTWRLKYVRNKNQV